MPNEPEYFARPDLVNLRIGGRITSFAELPEAAQLALAHYMSIDGGDWDIPVVLADEMDEIWLGRPPQEDIESRERLQKEAFRNALPYYIAQYGDFQIGYHPCIPTADLIAAVMNDLDPDLDLHGDFENWASYHDWYIKHAAMPEHDVDRELWPVILSSWEDETLQDGWHRFHHYVRSGVKCIPALYYD